MRNEFMLAINQVCAERQLTKEVVLEAVEAALITAYKRNFGSGGEITARIDPDTGAVHVFAHKTVTEKVTDPKTELSLEEARRHKADAQLGETILVEATPKEFGRIAAQTAKQVILQRIREAERDALYDVYAQQEGEIVNGTVQSIDSQMVIINLGKAEGILPKSEQIPGERYRLNQRVRSYVMEVEKTPRGPRITLSRNHRNMLRRLMELEVPEIFNGAVEIKSIAREPGARSKVAVAALRPGVDPVGSCVGMRGTRIQSIVNELNGEKIDVVEWSADVATFIANALSPAQVVKVHLYDGPDGKTATVIVPDKQLSLAIGKEGQNARLAAKLTGWRIDIKSASEAAAEVFAMPEAQFRPKEEEPQDLLARAEAILAQRKSEATEPAPVMDADEEELFEQLVGEEEIVPEPAEALVPSLELATPLETKTTPDTYLAEGADVQQEEMSAQPVSPLIVEIAPAENLFEQKEVREEIIAIEEAYPQEGGEIEPYAEDLEGDDIVGFETWIEDDEDDEEGSKKKKKHWHKKHTFEYDERAGKVVSRRKRKPNRLRAPWDDDY